MGVRRLQGGKNMIGLFRKGPATVIVILKGLMANDQLNELL
jgi:hypothetical protein